MISRVCMHKYVCIICIYSCRVSAPARGGNKHWWRSVPIPIQIRNHTGDVPLHCTSWSIPVPSWDLKISGGLPRDPSPLPGITYPVWRIQERPLPAPAEWLNISDDSSLLFFLMFVTSVTIYPACDPLEANRFVLSEWITRLFLLQHRDAGGECSISQYRTRTQTGRSPIYVKGTQVVVAVCWYPTDGAVSQGWILLRREWVSESWVQRY